MNPTMTIATRVGLSIGAALGASTALYLGRSIFIPLVVAILLAALLWPLATVLHKRLKFSWTFSVFASISGLILLNTIVFAAFAVTVPRVLQQIPQPNDYEGQARIYTAIREKLTLIVPDNARFEKVLPKLPENSSVFEYVRQFLKGEYITSKLLEISTIAASWVVQSLLILFILLFLMLEGEMLAKRIKEIFGPTKVSRAAVTETLVETADSVRTYLIWRTVVNAGLGLFLGGIYAIVGLSEPWTWALFTMVLCYVPYIGTLMAGFPPIVDAFFTISPWAAVGITLFFIVVVTLEGYIIVPVVMGRSMSLNATTVLLTCLYWDLVWGTMGLFLAMPIMAAIKAILLHTEGYQLWGHLLSTEVAVAEAHAKDLARAVTLEDKTDIILR
jgi:AI-2 transport protein TqsA